MANRGVEERPVPGRLRLRRAAGIVALAAAVVLTGLAVSGMDRSAELESRARLVARPGAEAPLADMSGMIVVRDPETGEFRSPGPGEVGRLRAETAALFDQSTAGLEGVRLPNGAWKLDLQGRFQNATVVAVGPDGRREVVCAEHPDQVADAAHRALHGTPVDADGWETR